MFHSLIISFTTVNCSGAAFSPDTDLKNMGTGEFGSVYDVLHAIGINWKSDVKSSTNMKE